MIRRQVIGAGLVLGIVSGILIDTYMRAYPAHIIYVAEAKEEVIQIEVEIDWSTSRIEKEIRTVFNEEPDLAVAIAKCESGLDADVQSQHTLSYGQERSFGVFQVHEPHWGAEAERLELHNWRTDPGENIQLARHIYDKAGKRFTPWVCYTKNLI